MMVAKSDRVNDADDGIRVKVVCGEDVCGLVFKVSHDVIFCYYAYK